MLPDNNSPRITHLNCIPLRTGDVDILPSSKTFHDKVFELIRQARQRIYLSALYLENDATGRKMLDALYEAKAANPQLDIVILVDFHRAQRGRIGEAGGINTDLYMEKNRENKHSIDIFGLPVKGHEFFGVMHLKGFVFDNTVLYSGASINDVYFHAEKRYRYDRYTLIHSTILADTLTSFVRSLNVERGVLTPLNQQTIPSAKSMKKRIKRSTFALKRAQYTVPLCADDHDTLHVTPLLGCGRRGNKLNRAIIDIIRKADKEIILYTPYFNFPSALKKALVKAMRRHVQITLVVGDKTASDFYIHDPTKFSIIGVLPYLYELLLRGFLTRYKPYLDQGLLTIRLWKHGNNSFHVKGVSVDQQHYLLTGNNLNPRAWGLDLENALLLYDGKKQLKTLFADEHDTILANTTELTAAGQLDNPETYPAQVKKMLGRLKRIRADSVLKHFI